MRRLELAAPRIAATVIGLMLTVTGVSSGQSLQESLSDSLVGSRWEYNNWGAARAAALREKKPIFALFR